MQTFRLLSLFFITASILSSCEKEVEKLIEPRLIVSVDTLSFTDDESKSFYISTKPAINCDYQIVSYPDWVVVTPESGSISNAIQRIDIESNCKSKSPGIHTGRLIVMSSTSGMDTVYLKLTVGQKISYAITDILKISAFSNEGNYTIDNKSNVGITYSARVSNNYVTLSNLTGFVAAGEQKDFGISINRENLVNGLNESLIFVKINDNIDTIKVTIDHFKENKIMLESDVVDAEFSKVKDYLAFVSVSSMKLNLYYPASNSIVGIDLAYAPTCVSLSLDGNFAAVGHDGHISYVDINNRSVIRTYDVSCYANDIALGKNNWVYVFPREDQWVKFLCVDLSLLASNEVAHTGNLIFAKTKAKLHPSGKYIYGANNGLSPSDIEKYDIQSNTASYLYDSPYHGDYPMNGDLWFSEDGLRIFTRGKSVLKTSPIKEQDMLYNGKIIIEGSSTYSSSQIQGLDHSAAKNNLYIISTGDNWNDKIKPFVYIYNATNLVYKSKIELEKYLVKDNLGGGTFYDCEPYFVFCNSLGNNVYVLTKAIGSGLLNEWSIQKISI